MDASSDNKLTPQIQAGVTLLNAPIELAGNWRTMIPHSAEAVVELMRSSCLENVRLLSDRQPTRLRVDEHPSGSPAIWLHDDGSSTAWIIVDIGERAWSQLSYQFGHELGHVLANSWQAHANPGGPSQWLEESIVEAFSFFGLGRLAANWERQPPFPNDNGYGVALASYRKSALQGYDRLAAEQGGIADWAAWYRRHRTGIEAGDGLNAFARACSSKFVAAFEQNPACIEALGALNRWPNRSRLPLSDYLEQWEASCHELGASPALPTMIRRELRLS